VLALGMNFAGYERLEIIAPDLLNSAAFPDDHY